VSCTPDLFLPEKINNRVVLCIVHTHKLPGKYVYKRDIGWFNPPPLLSQKKIGVIFSLNKRETRKLAREMYDKQG